jgi:CO/xanthine dehydrogenase FAD-binding subunit
LKPAPFAYAKARSLDHAIELLAGEADARILAGGQSLIATLNMRLSHPALLVDINGIGGLARIALQDGSLEIGALTRHAQAERSAEVARHAPLIAMAMPHIGHPAIRNRGTVGGSIAFADPAAELPACLLALGGEILIAGPGRTAQRQGGRFLQRPVRDRAQARRNAHRDPRTGSDARDAVRFRRVRPPSRRLRHGRPRRLRPRGPWRPA